MEKADGTHSCKHQGTQYDLKTRDEVEDLRKKIEDQGYYPFLTNDKEMEDFGKDKSKVDVLFTKLMLRRIEEWVELADERLKDKKFECYFQPANDDRYEIDPILEKSRTMINPDGKVIQLDKDHEMMGSGHANITPWDCPRDETEEKLEQIIDGMASQVRNLKNCVFNFHCPPYDTVPRMPS